MAENENSMNDAVFEAGNTLDEGATPEANNDLEVKVAKLEGDLARANLEVLKAQAEFENFRRRVRRESEEEIRYASLPLVRDLLQITDNLQRATQAAEQSGGAGGLVDGVKMVAMHFDQILAKHGCVTIEALGLEFDPHVHQAIGQQPSDQYPAGTVCMVTQSGYRMHDRVVRPTLVFVSTGPA